MRRTLCILLPLGLLAAAPAHAAPASVSAGNYFYKPFRVKVQPGEAVNWRVVDGDPHTMTSERGTPAGRGEHLVDLAGQATGEQVAVVLVVVHDQDHAAVLCGPIADGLRARDLPRALLG